MSRASSQQELAIKVEIGYSVWRFLVRFVAPVLVGLALIWLLFEPYIRPYLGN